MSVWHDTTLHGQHTNKYLPSLSLFLSLNSFVKIVGANIVRQVSGLRLRFRFGDMGSLRLWTAGNTRATVIGGSSSISLYRSSLRSAFPPCTASEHSPSI